MSKCCEYDVDPETGNIFVIPMGSDVVRRPDHYNWHPAIECKYVTQEFNFNLGNVIKYVWRAGRKDDVIQDLEKAAEYLRNEIARLRAQRGEK